MAKKSSVQVNITIPLEWKQSDIDMIAKARAWAVKAHAGQKDKAGKDYFKAHVTVVAEGVKGDPIAEAVADYESRMTEALSELCSCEGIPFSNAIARIVAWKPDKQ